MKAGSFKVCFIGVLGASSKLLNQVKHNIANYETPLTTVDVVTAIELGIPGFYRVFNIDVGSKVQIVEDVLQPALKKKSERSPMGESEMSNW